MSPQEAYQVIFNATGSIQCNRENHKLLEQALVVIQAAITSTPKAG